MLRIVPDSDIGIVVLTNCDNAEFAYQTVINELLKELADIDLTEPEPSFVTVHDQQLTHYLGDYQSAGEYFSFAVDGNQLTATYKHLALNTPATTLRFKALDETLWIGFNEEGIAVTKLRFLNPDAQGVYAYLFNGQMIQRIS